MKVNLQLNNIKKINFNFINFQNIFFFGIFLLPSAVLPALICLLISLIYSLISKKKSSLSEPSNLILLITSGLMIFNTLTICLKNLNNDLPGWSNINAFIGLFNWLPLFVLFWGLQPYLKSNKQRQTFSVCIVGGTIPIVITAIGQYLFGWHGPFDFYGLITWYQRPLNINDGVTGLFNNPNYAGTWLSLAWPFSLEIFQRSKSKKAKKVITAFISISILITALLTLSRNTFIGLFITLFISLNLKLFLIILFLFIFFEILILISIIFVKFGLISIFAGLSNSVYENIISFDYQYTFPRIEIWFKSISLIYKRIWIGWGPTSFPNLYKSNYQGLDIQHTHNMVLELAHNFGIPSAIILSLFVLCMILKSYKIVSRIENNQQLVNKFWIISMLIIFISHLFDITYYDGRFNTISWIILAGIKCIIDDEKLKENTAYIKR